MYVFSYWKSSGDLFTMELELAVINMVISHASLKQSPEGQVHRVFELDTWLKIIAITHETIEIVQ